MTALAAFRVTGRAGSQVWGVGRLPELARHCSGDTAFPTLVPDGFYLFIYFFPPGSWIPFLPRWIPLWYLYSSFAAGGWWLVGVGRPLCQRAGLGLVLGLARRGVKSIPSGAEARAAVCVESPSSPHRQQILRSGPSRLPAAVGPALSMLLCAHASESVLVGFERQRSDIMVGILVEGWHLVPVA